MVVVETRLDGWMEGWMDGPMMGNHKSGVV